MSTHFSTSVNMFCAFLSCNLLIYVTWTGPYPWFALTCSSKRDRDAGTEATAAAEQATAARIKEEVSRVQRETRRKYRARVSEVEAAFAQLAADNRRLKARVGYLSGVGSARVSGEEADGRQGETVGIESGLCWACCSCWIISHVGQCNMMMYNMGFAC